MKQFYFFCSLLLFSIFCSAQGFEFAIDGEGTQSLNWGGLDSEGNVLFVGFMNDAPELPYDGLIVKVFPDGNYSSFRYNNPVYSDICFISIDILPDDRYFIIASVVNDQTDNILVLIFNSDLEVLSEKLYALDDSYSNLGKVSTAIASDGNIVMATVATATGDYRYGILFYKFSPEGDTLFTRADYYEPRQQALLWFSRIPDSDELLLVARRLSNLSGRIEFCYFDNDLNLLDSHVIPSVPSLEVNVRDPAHVTHWLNDQEFLMSCYTSFKDNPPFSEQDLTVYRLSREAVFLDTLRIVRPDTIDYPASYESMAYVNDSTIYVAGQTSHNDPLVTPELVSVFLIDADLNLLGRYDYGGDLNYWPKSVIATADGGCMVVSNRAKEYPGGGLYYNLDAHIKKVMREDIALYSIGLSESAGVSSVTIQAYPNPVRDLFHVRLPISVEGTSARFVIYDLQGRKVYDSRLSGKGNLLTMDLSNLPSGAYTYRLLHAEAPIGNGKFIKE
ncbi:MAG: T9SS type A sorting domain-containing protein [Lentimicrobiaceae bacterium]|jgi:hypothetical protein|nr:T9SS type A sorting domain-containing protein [Lentimicrobiaceae bacterium]